MRSDDSKELFSYIENTTKREVGVSERGMCVCVSERGRRGCTRSFYGRACVNENFFRTILFGEESLNPSPPPSFFRTCGCSRRSSSIKT